MQRSAFGNTLKQVLNNLFVAHIGSMHSSEVSFFKRSKPLCGGPREFV
jgi:hypothetical protein